MGDSRFIDYTTERLVFIEDAVEAPRELLQENPDLETAVESIFNAGALEDTGVMSAAMIIATQDGYNEDPAFCYHRPINGYAAHGYGPVILAGAEVLELTCNHEIEINDIGLQVYGPK